MEQTNFVRTKLDSQRLVEYAQMDQNHRSRGNAHACKACQRVYQQACDRLKRAERDLGETAAFIAASLTTATAIEAVINIAMTSSSYRRIFCKERFISILQSSF
jgi:hypothetical protein